MTIKKQITIYISGIIAIPVLGIFFLWCYNYVKRPESVLFEGSEIVEELKKNNFTDEDISQLREDFRKLPQSVEFIIIQNDNKVIATNCNDFYVGKEYNTEQLFNAIKDENNNFIYQISDFNQGDSPEDILIAFRIPKQNYKYKPFKYYWISGFMLLILIFEIFLITFITRLSRTIYKSIGILEKNTKRIVDGNYDEDSQTYEPQITNNEITSLSENINTMRESLKENHEQKRRFIMGISHDLRSPVAVVKGYTEALKDHIISDPAQTNEALDIIEGKATQLEGMIDTLINFVKFESTDLRNSMNLQPFKSFMESYIKTCRISAEVFKRKFESEINLSENTLVSFNNQLLERAFENLFNNALRYTKEGDLIKISVIENENEISIHFSDTGMGISKENQKQIFELFYRASPSRQDGGMGIGLNVVETIIKTHGWNINVDSKINEGTDFLISIPKN